MDHHIYILNCQVSRENGVVKLGRTGNLKNRLAAYKSIFPDASYRYVYHLKKADGILLEKEILKETIDLHADFWKTEWRKMSPQRLHGVVLRRLADANVEFDVRVEPGSAKEEDSNKPSPPSNKSISLKKTPPKKPSPPPKKTPPKKSISPKKTLEEIASEELWERLRNPDRAPTIKCRHGLRRI